MQISMWLFVATGAATAALAAPVPNVDYLELAQCEERVVNVLANDAETVSDALPLRLVSVEGARLGTATLASSDSIRYKAGDKAGTDQLVYVVANARGETIPAAVTVVIKEGGSCS